MWKAASAPDGRTYYYNEETKETRWNKPDEADISAAPRTPATPATPSHDPAAVDAAWREASAGDGKTYYYNAITRETKWQPPPGFVRQQEQGLSQAITHQAAPEFVAGGGGNSRSGANGYPVGDRRQDRRDVGLPIKPGFEGGRGGGGAPWESRHEGLGFRGPMPVKTDEPNYSTFEQAEEAFFSLLRKHDISPDTEWEDALRLVIREREYRALKEPRERKQAFEKFCIETRIQQKNKEKERREKLREEFRKMLTTHPDIKHYSRWKSARRFIEREAVYKQASDDNERKVMFDDYVKELKRNYEEESHARRQAAKEDVEKLLQTRITEPETRWEAVKEDIIDPERSSNLNLKHLTDLDILTVFETHIKMLNNRAHDTARNEKRMAARRDRQARDEFKTLLRQKLAERKIKSDGKWRDFLPLVESDERFLRVVNTHGSSPLELFRDVVEAEDREFRSKRMSVRDVLEERDREMTIDMKYEEFVSIVRSDPRVARLAEEDLRMIYNSMMDKLASRQEDGRSDHQRRERRTVDALRSVIKRLDPPVRPSDTYEDVASRLATFPEFKTASLESRKQAFEKYNRRLRDRDDDHERDRSRPRRERDRDHRNGSRREPDRDRDRRHRTRSPEVDAYEADRRKAQADRERHYRKPSFALTPPPRDRREDRDDRYRRRDTHDSHYDRERKERDVEREHNYVSRADPRDRGRALDYGDEDASSSRPGSIRKRRDSEASMGSRRDQKRSRRGRTPTPANPGEAAELQSGSEEGEIEEV